MAKTVKINGVAYTDVPSVEIPLSTGNGNAVFYETGSATATADKILQGYVAWGAAGQITGTMTAAAVSQDSTTKVLSVS